MLLYLAELLELAADEAREAERTFAAAGNMAVVASCRNVLQTLTLDAELVVLRSCLERAVRYQAERSRAALGEMDRAAMVAELGTLSDEQRGALAHLLNNALAPVLIEADEMAGHPVGAEPLLEAVNHLLDVVRAILS